MLSLVIPAAKMSNVVFF